MGLEAESFGAQRLDLDLDEILGLPAGIWASGFDFLPHGWEFGLQPVFGLLDWRVVP